MAYFVAHSRRYAPKCVDLQTALMLESSLKSMKIIKVRTARMTESKSFDDVEIHFKQLLASYRSSSQKKSSLLPV
jgi:hypothetical protein